MTQNGVLHGVVVDRLAGIIMGERDEFDKRAFEAHAQLFA